MTSDSGDVPEYAAGCFPRKSLTGASGRVRGSLQADQRICFSLEKKARQNRKKHYSYRATAFRIYLM